METSRPESIESAKSEGTPSLPYLPPIDEAELSGRNQAVMLLLDAWAEDEDGDEDQRETEAILRVALGEGRVAS